LASQSRSSPFFPVLLHDVHVDERAADRERSTLAKVSGLIADAPHFLNFTVP